MLQEEPSGKAETAIYIFFSENSCAVRLTLVANIAELVTDVYLLGFNNLALVLCPVALLFSHYKALCGVGKQKVVYLEQRAFTN